MGVLARRSAPLGGTTPACVSVTPVDSSGNATPDVAGDRDAPVVDRAVAVGAAAPARGVAAGPMKWSSDDGWALSPGGGVKSVTVGGVASWVAELTWGAWDVASS